MTLGEHYTLIYNVWSCNDLTVTDDLNVLDDIESNPRHMYESRGGVTVVTLKLLLL